MSESQSANKNFDSVFASKSLDVPAKYGMNQWCKDCDLKLECLVGNVSIGLCIFRDIPRTGRRNSWKSNISS